MYRNLDKKEFLKFEIDNSVSSTLDYYEDILKNFPEWINSKREIKLLSVLGNKKIKFEVGNINSVLPNKSSENSLWGVFGFENEPIVSLQRVCFVINSLSFILYDQKIEKMNITIQVLTTQYGKILRNLLENSKDINIKICQHIENEKVVYFYIDTPELAA